MKKDYVPGYVLAWLGCVSVLLGASILGGTKGAAEALVSMGICMMIAAGVYAVGKWFGD